MTIEFMFKDPIVQVNHITYKDEISNRLSVAKHYW